MKEKFEHTGFESNCHILFSHKSLQQKSRCINQLLKAASYRAVG
jgi:hypothetical protein